jgi:hypothetical protein
MSVNQMINHELNPLKGWPSPYALDKTLEVSIAAANSSTAITLADAKTYFVSGKVATQTSTGRLVLGCQDHAAGVCPMPIFIFPNAKDFDVVGDDGSIVGMNVGPVLAANGANAGFNWTTGGGGTPFVQRPLVTGLVATGGYELETTEYYDATPSTTFVPGRLLEGKVWTTTNPQTKDQSGKLISATVDKNTTICGVVSDGLVKSEFTNAPYNGLMGTDGSVTAETSAGYTTGAGYRLRFWPVFLPVWSVA